MMRLVRNYKRLLAVCWIVLALLAFGALRVLGFGVTLPTAEGVIRFQGATVLEEHYAVGGSDMAIAYAARYSQIARSDYLLNQVRADLGLSESVETLRLRVASAPVPGGPYVEITATGATADGAARLAQAVLDAIEADFTAMGPTLDDGRELLTIDRAGPVLPEPGSSSALSNALLAVVMGLVGALTVGYLVSVNSRRVRDVADVVDVAAARALDPASTQVVALRTGGHGDATIVPLVLDAALIGGGVVAVDGLDVASDRVVLTSELARLARAHFGSVAVVTAHGSAAPDAGSESVYRYEDLGLTSATESAARHEVLADLRQRHDLVLLDIGGELGAAQVRLAGVADAVWLLVAPHSARRDLAQRLQTFGRLGRPLRVVLLEPGK